MNMPQISKIMMEFEKQNELMDMKQEMVDDAFAGDEDEDEEENILGAVLQELGVEAASKMEETPSTAVMGNAAAATPGQEGQPAAVGGGDDLDAELQKRLDN